MALPFSHSLRVRYAECDMQGVVFNAHYVAYFDTVITELWRAAVGSWSEVTARGIDLVVAEVAVRYRAPARFDDVLEIGAGIGRLGTTAITTRLEVRRDGELLAEGELRHVAVDPGGGEKRPLPADVKRALGRFVV